MFSVVIHFILLSAVASAQSRLANSDPVWGTYPPDGTPETMNRPGVRTEGFVESIDKDGITLYWPARDVLRVRYNPKDGTPLEAKTATFEAVPANKFLLCKELARGKSLPGETVDYTYRFEDVKVGDRVSIRYDRKDGIDTCQAIRIDRRPGGRVPPAPGEKPNALSTHHGQMNAHQDWEENRIPYPRRYWPVYRDADGKLYASSFPSDSTQIVPVKAKQPEKK